MIAGTLKGAVAQRLVPTADGRGRLACCEILRMTGRVRDMIMDPTQTGRLPEVIAEGSFYGMQTFDQHLFDHLKAGRVTMQQALQAATRSLKSCGLVATCIACSIETRPAFRCSKRCWSNVCIP